VSLHEPVSVQAYQVKPVIALSDSGQVITISEFSSLIFAQLIQTDVTTTSDCVVISADRLSQRFMKIINDAISILIWIAKSSDIVVYLFFQACQLIVI
jgi:hypothetical protein